MFKVGRERERDAKRFDVAFHTRQFEIDLFWKRSLFFWGFIGAAFVAIGALKGDAPGLSLLVSSFGFICSLAWTLVNRGSKYWQQQWESKIEGVEDRVTGALFKVRETKPDKGWWGGYPYSVSKLATMVSDYVSLIWLLILIRQGAITWGWTASQFVHRGRYEVVAVAIITAVWTVIVLCKGETTRPL